MKKVLSLVMILGCVFVFATGCTQKQENITGDLEELMEKVYDGISDEEKPMMLQNTELTEENIEYYIGTKDIKWKEAVASESAVGSIAHSIVLIRMNDDATDSDIEEAKKEIEEKVDPRKWICVEAEKVSVESKGNLIVLIMTSEDMASTMEENFKNLK